MSYTYITRYDREHIEILQRLRYSSRAIGETLGRHHSSISRELRKNHQTSTYQAVEELEKYRQRRDRCVSKRKWKLRLTKKIEDKLKITWSSEQIAASEPKARLSFKTIYQWIYAGKLEHKNL